MKEIITDRLILRKVEISDVDDIFEILSDEETIENLNMEIHKSKDDTIKLIEDYLAEYEQRNKFPYAIINKESKKFVGVFLIKLDL